jgi:hypothetical protein
MAQGDGDRESGDEQRDAVGQHERQLVARKTVGDPESKPDQEHREVANLDAGRRAAPADLAYLQQRGYRHEHRP